MKRYLYTVLILFGLTACDDFLEEKSQDEVRPSTVGDIEQILLGDGYTSSDYNFYYATEILTDNFASNGVVMSTYQSEHDKKKWLYTWDEKMFTDAGGGYDANFWEVPYKGILGCNLVLDYLDEVDGEHRLRESLRGEALALRSWYFLHLVNFFGIAYNQGDPAVNPGVPLRLESAVTGEFYTRNTVKEVYTQIEKDLLEADRLLTEYDYERNFFRMGHLAVKAILSRVYLYTGEWDKALTYANAVLQGNSTLLDLNKLSWTTGSSQIANVLSTNTPDEIIWARENYRAFALSMPYVLPFSPSADLYNSYEGGSYSVYPGQTRDIRSYVYFYWYIGMGGSSFWYRIGMCKGNNDYGAFAGIRTAELYLNRAEAYTRKYIESGDENDRTEALKNLNLLRRNRFNVAFTYTDVAISDGQELLEFCIAERRRELCGETNHRWCDLRRCGMTVTHTLIENGSTEYTRDMTLYALPLPDEVLRRNPNLTQN